MGYLQCVNVFCSATFRTIESIDEVIRAPLEQAFEICQKNKSDWMSSNSALARAEMALKEHELISSRYEPDAVQALRDDIDLKKWAVNQSAGRYIRSHEAVQRVSMRRQLHAFMQVSGDTLAAALAPELMHLREQPEIVRERALDRAAASVREALWPAEEIFIMQRMTEIS